MSELMRVDWGQVGALFPTGEIREALYTKREVQEMVTL